MVEVSIVTRTLNRPQGLKRVAKGLSRQSFKAFEWIIVNDGGDAIGGDIADESKLQAKYGINIINHATSLGRAKAAIAGIEAAKGQTIMIHDDDDLLMPKAIETLYAALINSPSCVASTCGHEVIGETVKSGKFVTVATQATVNVTTLPLLQDLAKSNFIPTIGTLFRKDSYKAVGGLRSELDVLEDWDLWLRLMIEGDFAPVNDILAHIYVRSSDASGMSPQSDKVDHDHTYLAIKNYYLRQDIKAGKLGLGHLLNDPHAETFDEMSQLLKRLQSAKRIFSRRKAKSGKS